MIANIRNIDSHVSEEALLPFFNNTVEIELDSDSQKDIGFAERQLAFLSVLPVETYVKLCRHSVDYAADLVDYVGEYLGMFDEAFTACAIQWVSEVFQFPMPAIPVVFDPSQGISGACSFDFSMVRNG